MITTLFFRIFNINPHVVSISAIITTDAERSNFSRKIT